jgi:hypothetical protein
MNVTADIVTLWPNGNVIVQPNPVYVSMANDDLHLPIKRSAESTVPERKSQTMNKVVTSSVDRTSNENLNPPLKNTPASLPATTTAERPRSTPACTQSISVADPKVPPVASVSPPSEPAPAGIGCILQQNGDASVTIRSVMPGGPAAAANLAAGDEVDNLAAG